MLYNVFAKEVVNKMIGDKLQELLEAKQMKPGTLATRTGIPKSTIYGILKRNNKKAEFSVLEKISEELNVPVEYFLKQDENTNEQKNQLDPEADELEEFVLLFDKLTQEQKNFILSSMKGILAGK